MGSLASQRMGRLNQTQTLDLPQARAGIYTVKIEGALSLKG
jgi:hypothetical protein